MQTWKSVALSATLIAVPAAFMIAQEPGAARSGAPVKGIPAAIAASKEDPAAFERGAKAFAANCAGCHGALARGGAGAPDLIRSVLVLDDEKGILISPVLRNGRPDQGMPKPNLTEAEIADIVAWLHVQTYFAGHRVTYAYQDVLTGNAKLGETYFNATCTRCHSATGDLKGIGARSDAFTLQARWLQPRRTAKSAVTVTVTLSSGQKISGTLDRVDDFNISLHDSSGAYHSIHREGAVPKVEITDPLRVHTDLLAKYSDPDIHNMTAYLVTLK